MLPKMPKLTKAWFNSSKIESLDWLSSSSANVPELQSIVFLDNKVSKLPALNNFKNLTIHLTNNPVKNVSEFLKTKNSVITLKISLDI
jgi:hypothetical protein